MNVENFIGGILLYFWLVTEGKLWIRKIMKRSLKVISFRINAILIHTKLLLNDTNITMIKKICQFFLIACVSKHPKNTFVAYFRIFLKHDLVGPSKKLENVRQNYFLDVLSQPLLFHFGRLGY